MSPRNTLRLLAFVVLLLLATPMRSAGATAHAATTDNGASDGGSGTADSGLMIEQLGLVPTNGGPGSFTMEQTPVLVGSGAEREEVAHDQVPVLVGSGAEREEVAAEAAWSEAEMLRGGLSPVATEEVAVITVVAVASGAPEQAELTINGVRVE